MLVCLCVLVVFDRFGVCIVVIVVFKYCEFLVVCFGLVCVVGGCLWCVAWCVGVVFGVCVLVVRVCVGLSRLCLRVCIVLC